MTSILTRLLPLLLLACQSSDEVSQQEVSISPRLSAEPSSEPPPQPPPQGPRTTPGRAYPRGSGTTPVTATEDRTGGPFAAAYVPQSAHLDDSSPRVSKKGSSFEIKADRGSASFTWRITPQSSEQLMDVIEILDDGGTVRPFSGSNFIGIGSSRMLDARRVGDGLEVTYEDDLVQTFTPIGRSLRIDIERNAGLRRGRLEFHLGGALASGDAQLLRNLRVPYFDIACVAALAVDRKARYLTAWLDPSFSNASNIFACNPNDAGERGELQYAQEAEYLNATDGRRRPVRERVWVTWGDELGEVLPSMDRPASPARAELGQRYYLSYSNTPFQEAEEDLERLYGMGVRDLHVWMHHWQRDGYDTGYPDQVMPPRQEWGGLEGLMGVSSAAASMGFAFGLHHNWLFNSGAEPGNSLLGPDGRKVTTAEGGEYLKHRIAVDLVEEVEGSFHEAIGTVGTFTDSLTTGLPRLDMDAREADWGLLRGALDDYARVLASLRKVHGAPVAGEGSLGGGNVVWSGLVDVLTGTLFIAAREKATRRNGRYVDLLPEFALGRLHELSVRAGIGPPRRFMGPDRWTIVRGYSAEDLDLAATMTALLGNTGYHWWYAMTRTGSVARDWWGGREVNVTLSRAGRGLPEVAYFDERDRERDLDEVLVSGDSLRIGDVRMRLSWADGSELWLNFTAETWSPKGRDEALAPYGHLFVDGETLAGIVMLEDSAVRLSTSPTRRFLDGRGLPTEWAGLGTDGAVGLVPLDDPSGWQVFPILDYTLALPSLDAEQVVELSYVQLEPDLAPPGEYELVFQDVRGLDTHGETRTAGPDGLRLTADDFLQHAAWSVLVRPME